MHKRVLNNILSTLLHLRMKHQKTRCLARDVSRVSSLLRDVSRPKIRDKDRFARHLVCKRERVNDAKRCGTCKERKQLSFIFLSHETTYSIMNIGETYTQDTTLKYTEICEYVSYILRRFLSRQKFSTSRDNVILETTSKIVVYLQIIQISWLPLKLHRRENVPLVATDFWKDLHTRKKLKSISTFAINENVRYKFSKIRRWQR